MDVRVILGKKTGSGMTGGTHLSASERARGRGRAAGGLDGLRPTGWPDSIFLFGNSFLFLNLLIIKQIQNYIKTSQKNS